MSLKVEEQCQFLSIINRLEESILISNKNQIELANDDFLHKFNQYIVKGAQDNQESSINLSEVSPPESLFTRLKNNINIFKKETIKREDSDKSLKIARKNFLMEQKIFKEFIKEEEKDDT